MKVLHTLLSQPASQPADVVRSYSHTVRQYVNSTVCTATHCPHSAHTTRIGAQCDRLLSACRFCVYYLACTNRWACVIKLCLKYSKKINIEANRFGLTYPQRATHMHVRRTLCFVRNQFSLKSLWSIQMNSAQSVFFSLPFLFSIQIKFDCF